MLLFGASLTYDTSSVNYNRNMFIIQATVLKVLCIIDSFLFSKFPYSIKKHLGSYTLFFLFL